MTSAGGPETKPPVEPSHPEIWQSTFDALLDPVALVSTDGTIMENNQAFSSALGLSGASPVGQKCHRLVHHTDAHIPGCPLVRARSSNKRETMELPLGDKTFLVVVDPIRAPDGQPFGFVHVMRDLTEHKRTEEALQDARHLLQDVLDTIPVRVFWKDLQLKYLGCNLPFVRDSGLESPDALLGKDDFQMGWYEQAEAYRADDRAVIESGVPKIAYEEPQTTPDGGRIWVRTSKVQLRRGGGEVIGVLGTYEDITQQKRAQEEQALLAEQLRQAQKMETIGCLAGGVAHDFNNLLSVILNYTAFAIEHLPADEPIRDDLQAVFKAGQRAAELTKQLLAFSRKQVLQPEPLDLNRVVAEMDKLLRRIIGEDVELTLRLAPALNPVLADPSQLEQVVMNMVVNARDAMPGGGKLLVETANVELDADYAARHSGVTPGAYVMLAITDNGSGMDEQTRERIFEPFFTTKEKGKGTGLGLSTVYGIVKQSGGDIWVYSEPDQGTTFKIYLPRASRLAILPTATEPPPRPATGGETILVVEDEQVVRELIVRILEVGGYTVLSAADGATALQASQLHPGEIQLLLTDVVMPQMSGKQLREAMAVARPDLRVLFMSGYTDDAIVHNGILDPGTHFIGKPFSASELGQKIREVLDQSPTAE